MKSREVKDGAKMGRQCEEQAWGVGKEAVLLGTF